ncbi:MAG: leucine-rich repeat domain-containing protein [Mycoplasmataceae bacterium]|nr:leucine-rich repeat domain-containing protein [Mycoplasmataceae bacterium]
MPTPPVVPDEPTTPPSPDTPELPVEEYNDDGTNWIGYNNQGKLAFEFNSTDNTCELRSFWSSINDFNFSSEGIDEYKAEDLVIPEFIWHDGKKYQITSIAPRTFFKKWQDGRRIWSFSDGIKSITLPNSIKKIGQDAFTGIETLERLNIGDNVMEFDTGMFKDFLVEQIKNGENKIISQNDFEDGKFCNDGNGVYYLKNNIGESEKYYCLGTLPVDPEQMNAKSKLLVGIPEQNEIYIKENTSIILDHAFENEKKCKTINFQDSVKNIGESAFKGCEKLTELIFPNELFKIGANAFRNCHLINQIIIPNSVKIIGTSAFQSDDEFGATCQKIHINVSDDVTLGSNIFMNLSRIAEITFENFNNKELNNLNNLFTGTSLAGNQNIISIHFKNSSLSDEELKEFVNSDIKKFFAETVHYKIFKETNEIFRNTEEDFDIPEIIFDESEEVLSIYTDKGENWIGLTKWDQNIIFVPDHVKKTCSLRIQLNTHIAGVDLEFPEYIAHMGKNYLLTAIEFPNTNSVMELSGSLSLPNSITEFKVRNFTTMLPNITQLFIGDNIEFTSKEFWSCFPESLVSSEESEGKIFKDDKDIYYLKTRNNNYYCFGVLRPDAKNKPTKSTSNANINNLLFLEKTVNITPYAFKFENIQYVVFPETLKHIGTNAFGNTKLTNLLLPSNVQKIAQEAFVGIATLRNIALDFENLIFTTNYTKGIFPAFSKTNVYAINLKNFNNLNFDMNNLFNITATKTVDSRPTFNLINSTLEIENIKEYFQTYFARKSDNISTKYTLQKDGVTFYEN